MTPYPGAPMKIGFDVAQTCVERAGCGWYADSLIRAMTAIAPENRYFLYHRFGSWLSVDPSLGTQIQAACADMPFVGQEEKKSRAIWKAAAEGRMELPGEPDIVQSNSFQAPRVGGAKLVVVIHDISFWVNPEFTTEGNRLVCQRGIVDALKRADGFLFVSESSRNEFNRLLPGWLERNQKPSVVTYEASRLEVKPQTGGNEQNEFWLAVGSLEPRKNYENLLLAMELYWQRSTRRNPLHLAGGNGWSNERLLKQLSHMEERGLIRRLGYVPDQDLPGLYESAMALVFPSWYEGFGLPVLEAMQCGCPVISSDRTSLSEIGGDAVSYIDPESPESICDAMLRMESDGESRRDLVEAGRKQARKFSWETTAATTLDFYRKVLSQPV